MIADELESAAFVVWANYVLIFANSSAQAVATPELGVLPPRGVAQPPASINSRCLHESTFRNSASFAGASGCCMNLATQEGVNATTTAALVRSAAIRSAVLPRVQPSQVKPMIIVPIAPTTTPQAAGLNHGTRTCITHLFDCWSINSSTECSREPVDRTSFPEKRIANQNFGSRSLGVHTNLVKQASGAIGFEERFARRSSSFLNGPSLWSWNGTGRHGGARNGIAG